MKTLNGLCVQVLIDQLSNIRYKDSCKNITEEAIIECYKYFWKMGRLINTILPKLNYSQSRLLSQIFLPFIFQTGTLIMTEENATAVMQYSQNCPLIKDSCFHKLHSLLIHSWCSKFSHINNSLKMSFFQNLKNLTILSFDMDMNNANLHIVVNHCSALQVLDCSQSSIVLIDSETFGSLIRLQHLRYILFSRDPNEYDASFKDITISSSLIASVMVSLPKLVKIQCPDYKIKHALRLIDDGALHSIKSMHLEGHGCRHETFSLASKICPNLEELILMVTAPHAMKIDETLSSFQHLNKLTISIHVPMNHMKTLWGPKLVLLDIKTDMFFMEDFVILGNQCINLKILCVFDQLKYNASFRCEHIPNIESTIFFPSLITFVYSLRNFNGLGYILPMLSNLRNLYAKCDTLVNSQVAYDTFTSQLSPSFILPNLNKLVIPQMCLSEEMAKLLVASLPNLLYLNINAKLPAMSTVEFRFDSYEIFPPKPTCNSSKYNFLDNDILVKLDGII